MSKLLYFIVIFPSNDSLRMYDYVPLPECFFFYMNV